MCTSRVSLGCRARRHRQPRFVLRPSLNTEDSCETCADWPTISPSESSTWSELWPKRANECSRLGAHLHTVHTHHEPENKFRKCKHILEKKVRKCEHQNKVFGPLGYGWGCKRSSGFARERATDTAHSPPPKKDTQNNSCKVKTLAPQTRQ